MIVNYCNLNQWQSQITTTVPDMVCLLKEISITSNIWYKVIDRSKGKSAKIMNWEQSSRKTGKSRQTDSSEKAMALNYTRSWSPSLINECKLHWALPLTFPGGGKYEAKELVGTRRWGWRGGRKPRTSGYWLHTERLSNKRAKKGIYKYGRRGERSLRCWIGVGGNSVNL